MNEDHQTQTDLRRIDNFDDEIELIDILLVIWKWKYVILAGTLAFGIAAAIISFIALKQQPVMYRTSIVLKPGIVKIDENDKKVFIDTPENIKNLIENDLKYNILSQIKNSNNSKLSNTFNFQTDIPKGSDLLNVSLESTDAKEDTKKLNYLVKDLLAEYAKKIEYLKSGMDEQIEQEKNKIIGFKAEIEKIKTDYLNQIDQKKMELSELFYKEKRLKKQIEYYQQELSEIGSKIKLLENNKDISQSKEYFVNMLSVENDYRNTFQKYFEINESAHLNLFDLQNQIATLSNELKNFQKTKNGHIIDPDFQPRLYDYREKIIKEKKDIETLEKEKPNIQNIQIIQPPDTKELPKNNKIMRNVVLSAMMGLFLMIFLAFLLEYISNYKKRVSNK
jgi:capsular polysaccharide biosynthesis protein